MGGISCYVRLDFYFAYLWPSIKVHASGAVVATQGMPAAGVVTRLSK